ncbi:MAG: ATPase, T2SS/T4P/T4SS family, partial [Thermodesulfobacteriota bacterium]|nr:ATPase, T2SS/T4P/T4SS family [Thermodesulfobacteriota bacterium]
MAKPAPKNSLSRNKLISSKKSSLKATIKDQSGAGKTRIGELLCKEGHITSIQLQEALNYQKKNNRRLGSILLQLGYIEDETIVNILSRLHNYPAAIISNISPDPEAVKILPYDVAKKYMAFPLRLKNQVLEVTMTEPTDTSAVEVLQSEVRMALKVFVSTEKDIIDAFRKYYDISDDEYNSFFDKQTEDDRDDDEPPIQIDDFGSLVSEAAGDMELETPVEDEARDEFSANDAPIIKLTNGILIKAVNDEVSDIHIEPFETSLQVRYRLDGSLYKSMNLPLGIKNALISRIKILSGMNIAERRVPQDGRIKMHLGKRRTVDFRVSSLPTLF